MLTVERLDDGEVSPYLADVLMPGDELELRGPIGGYFVWEEALGGPLVLIAGGSGVVPLRSMLRHWSSTGRGVPARMVYSSRRLSEVIYREELTGYGDRDGLDLRLVLTREWVLDDLGIESRIGHDLGYAHGGCFLPVVRTAQDSWSASHRSASSDAAHPVPAAVTAWRYVWLTTSPQAKTPSTPVRVLGCSTRR